MKKWIKLAGLVVVTGCSSVSKKAPEQDVVKSVAPKTEKSAKIEKQTSIDPDTLYLLLAGELAGQRKAYNVALDAYLQAAQRARDPRVAERATRIALYLKDPEKIEQAVQLWLEDDPDNLSARKIALLSAMRNADKAFAIEQLNAYLKLDPAGFESVLLEMAKVMARNGREDQMLAILNELAAQHPEQASIFYVKALLAAKRQQYEQAMVAINQALAIQPGWKKAIIMRVKISVRTGKLDLAEHYLQEAINQYSDDIKFRKMLAQVYMEAKKYDQAVDVYRDILDIDKDDTDSQFAIALIYLNEEKLDDAKEIFRKLVHKKAWEGQATYYLGRIALMQERPEEALVWFDHITQGPYAFEARLAAVSVLMEQKQFEQVESRLSALARDFPDKKMALISLKSELYNATGRQREAFDLLSEGLKQFPDNKDLLYERALIAEQLNKLDVLERDLHKILQKNPNDAAALNALGYTLVEKTDRYQEAEKYLQKALSLKPDSAVIIDSYGWLKYKQGDLQQALTLIRKAYEKQPETEIAVHLAEILWKLQAYDEAKAVFDEAWKKHPDDKYLLDFKKRFLNDS